MRTLLFSLAALLCVAASGRAMELPTLPTRTLIMEATVIVLAEPVEPMNRNEKQFKFKVVEVLKGESIKSGDVITVINMEEFTFGESWWDRKEPSKKRPAIVKALLFLKRPQGSPRTSAVFVPVLSGVRCLDAERRVLWPVQFMNPGGYYLVPQKNADWNKLLASVRADIPKIAGALALKEIVDLAERNRAIFAWIEKHRNEFTGSFFCFSERDGNDAKQGWADLEHKPFEWILETHLADDAWHALKLAQEISHNPNCYHGFCGYWGVFASPEGRKLLLGVIADPKTRLSDREMALSYLRGSCWPATVREHPNLASLTPREQTDIFDKITPLLKDQNAETRKLAAQTLGDASNPWACNLQSQKTLVTLPSLIDAYRNEPPGETRNEMALIVLRMGGAVRWAEITGNPNGTLIIVEAYPDDTAKPTNIQLYLFNQSLEEYAIAELPTLIFEQLGRDDKVLKRQSMPLNVTYPKDIWQKGWPNGNACVYATVSLSSLTVGRWRFVVEGTLGNDPSKKWRSEPAILDVKWKP